MRCNIGYEIILSHRTGKNEEVVLGRRAGNEFVTWLCINGNDYYWGHYTDNFKDALRDYTERAGISLKKPERVYISGQITGLPDEEWNKNFDLAEKALVGAGYRVINPAKVKVDLDYAEYLEIDIAMLHMCDAIYMLDNWENSNGARIERESAEAIGMTVIDKSNRELYLAGFPESEQEKG